MKRVFKYTLEYKDTFILDLPTGAKPVYFDIQNEQPRLWCFVDPEMPKEPVSFAFVGTGHEMPRIREGKEWKHIGSCMQADGQLVWHLFVCADPQ